MAKFLNPETYEEVEAFSEDELKTKIEEVKKGFEKDFIPKEEFNKKQEEFEKQKTTLEEVQGKYDTLSKVHEEQKTNLSKMKEGMEKNKKEDENKRETEYNTKLEESVKKIAGDDKEYAEALLEQAKRVGGVTNSEEDFTKQLRDAHVLAQTALERQVTAFNPSAIANGGDAPEHSDEKDDSGAEATADYLVNL